MKVLATNNDKKVYYIYSEVKGKFEVHYVYTYKGAYDREIEVCENVKYYKAMKAVEKSAKNYLGL